MNKSQKDKIKWVILLGVLTMMFFNPAIDNPKKESSGEITRTILGVVSFAVGLGLLFIQLVPAAGFAFIIGIALMSSGITGLLIPDSLLPGWAYVAGFIMLLFIILKGGKKK